MIWNPQTRKSPKIVQKLKVKHDRHKTKQELRDEAKRKTQ